MYLVLIWSTESELSSRLRKSFPAYFCYEKIIFESLQQKYACGLPEIKFSEYFGGAKAIRFYILTDPLLAFHGLSNEYIGFWIKCFSAKKLDNAQTWLFQSFIWIHTQISRKLFVPAEIEVRDIVTWFSLVTAFFDHKIRLQSQQKTQSRSPFWKIAENY
jgi:hypothetical protein